MTESKVKIELFNGENYNSWSKYMRAILLSKHVWDVVNHIKKPEFPDEALFEYKRQSNIALGQLFLHMKVEYHHIIEGCNEAWEAWMTMKKLFQGQQKAGRIYLKKELFSLEMKEGDNVLQHCNGALN